MGAKGDLLELIDGTPHNLQTFEGRLWKWTHNDRTRQAIKQLSNQRGGSVGFASIGVPQETSDEHLHVALEPPTRWSIRGGERVDVSNGSRRWIGSNNHVTEIDLDVPNLDDTELGVLITPGAHLFGAVKFDEPVEDEVADRRCWKVTATIASGTARREPMLLGMRLGGIDHTFWFDAVTGVILRHSGDLDDQPCSASEFSNITINELVDRDVFTFTPLPGTTVERRIDQLIRIAE